MNSEKDKGFIFRENDFPEKRLPENHEEEFLAKLNKLHKAKNKQFPLSKKLAVAACTLLFLGLVGYYFTKEDNLGNTDFEDDIIVFGAEQEQQYLANIDREWERFLSLTDDQVLIERYRNRLDELDRDYQELSELYQLEKDNVVVLEALVENLKIRLRLLKDIQEHIQLLNQKKQHDKKVL